MSRAPAPLNRLISAGDEATSPVHAVFHADISLPATLVTAECGAVATFRAGKQSLPPDFAFVTHPHMHEATCWRCKEKMRQRQQRGRRKRERAAR